MGISLLSFSEYEVLEQEEEKRKTITPFPVAIGEDTETRLHRIEEKINSLVTQFETLSHHVEHELASVDDHISNMGSKLEKREDKAEGRIEDLEAVIKKEVDGTLESRLNRLELQLNGNMNRKAKGMESQLNKQLESSLESSMTSAGSWKLPFLIIVVLLLASAIGLFIFYKKLIKRHIL